MSVGAVVLGQGRALLVRQAEGPPAGRAREHPLGRRGSRCDPGERHLREIQEAGGIAAEMEGLLGIQNLRREGWLAAVFPCHHAGGEPTPDGGHESDRDACLSQEEPPRMDRSRSCVDGS